MRIVGPVRLRTIHTKEDVCKIETSLTGCFQDEMSEDSFLFKDPIDGIEHKTCEEIGISHDIQGE